MPTAGVDVSSDAAGSLGFGAYLEGMWFTGSWMPSQREQSIAFKELFPVVVSAHVWGLTFGAGGMFYFDQTTTVWCTF